MIDTKNPAPTSAPLWQSVTDPMPVPDTSLLPPTDSPALVGDDLLKRVVQGAHSTIDRLADGVAPTVRQLGESVSRAEVAVQEKAGQIRETGDEWAENLRVAVRNNPLAAIAGALLVGALIARITR